MQPITSKNNPIVKELCALKEKKGRKEKGTFLVEGEKMVRECQKSGLEIVRAVLSESFYLKEGWKGDFLLLGEDAFRAVSDEKTPQGILAEVKIPRHPLAPPKNCCLLLDGLQDPSNVGAIIRTAVAAGYREIYLCGCADPFAPKCVRASMSGVFYATLMRGSVGEALKALKGVPILAADMGGEDVFSFLPQGKFCLAIGSEGSGLSSEVKLAAKAAVGIPMEGDMESLNAAVSAGIVMYALRQNKI